MFVPLLFRRPTLEEECIYLEAGSLSQFNRIFHELDYDYEVYGAILKTFKMNYERLDFIEGCKRSNLSNQTIREYLGVDLSSEWESIKQMYNQMKTVKSDEGAVSEEEQWAIYHILHYKGILDYNERRLYQKLSDGGKRSLYNRLYCILKDSIDSFENKNWYVPYGYFNWINHNKQTAIRCMMLIDMIHSI